jgi:toluene monooxygenase system ferredoxin subunit
VGFSYVCPLDDLWQGEMQRFAVAGREVLVVHTRSGEIRACPLECPHQRMPLDEGDLDGDVLMCAAHNWTFNVVDGRGINPGHSALSFYPVLVEDDAVWVAVE